MEKMSIFDLNRKIHESFLFEIDEKFDLKNKIVTTKGVRRTL